MNKNDFSEVMEVVEVAFLNRVKKQLETDEKKAYKMLYSMYDYYGSNYDSFFSLLSWSEYEVLGELWDKYEDYDEEEDEEEDEDED